LDKIVAWLIKYRKIVYIFFLALLAVSLFLIPRVRVNYDLAHYLPEESKTKQAIDVLETEFGYPGMADVMVANVSIPEAIAAKETILAVAGVKNVIWLDDITNVLQPLSFISQELLDQYYKGNNALFQVEFAGSNYSQTTTAALEGIREQLGDKVSIAGAAEDTRYMQTVLASEIFQIMIVVVPLCIIILMFASHSWIEPFLYLAVIGVSILLNMGSNIVFPSISFITHAMAAVLQLAISMDYSLFICHRYTEERSNGLEPLPAVLAAAKKSVKSISASSTTTIAGFLALIFMQYSIGADIGLVLAKGILISYLTVLILMPLLLYSCRNLIEKSKHRQFLPSFKKFGHSVVKLRYLIIALVLIVAIPSFLAQRNNTYLYGDTSGSSGAGEYAQQRQRIDDLFGTSNPVMLLVPNADLNGEIALCAELKASPYIKNVTALVTVADPAIPREFLPQAVRDNFLSQDYSRIIVNLAVAGESPETFAAVEFIESAADKWLAAGTATSVADIKSTVETDNLIVSIFSLAAVGIIILLTFRSLTLPILLVAVIQIAIWINMGVPYFTGSSLVFIGYLVIKSLQLGATIDYAILLTNRYMDFRLQHLPREAAALALRASGGSVLTSALILSLAGYAEGLMSKIDAISTIGMLLGRGAALSGILVLTLLPVLLMVFDPVIMSTTLGTKLIRHKEKRSA
jgi:hypothetical protein